MAVAPVMFSSQRGDWATPDALFAELDAEFHFTLDVCATATSAKCARFYEFRDNALWQPWDGVCWMNPPYGKDIRRWMARAWEASQAGATVVCLVPSRTDTSWWHDFAMRGEIRFIRGRLHFDGCASGAPFPSALVVFRPEGSELTRREGRPMAIQPRQRRGRSLERRDAERFFDLQADADYWLARLRQEAYPWDPVREQDRRACVATLAAYAAPARRYQGHLEADIAAAEGFHRPRSA